MGDVNKVVSLQESLVFVNGNAGEKVKVDEKRITSSEPSSEMRNLLTLICSENEENKNYAIKTFLNILVSDIPSTMITSCSLIYATSNPDCVKIVITNGFEHILKKLIETNTLKLDLLFNEELVKNDFVLETYTTAILKLPEETVKKFLLKFLIQEFFKLPLNEDIRNSLIELSFKIIDNYPITSFSENDIKSFTNDVFKRYTKILEHMRQLNNPNWHKLWMFLVRFLAKHLHTATELANGLLRVVEYAFRNTSCEQRLKGYECWKELIDNASLDKNHMCSQKQFKLLVTPLKAKFSRIEVIICKRFNTFVYLLEKLQDSSVLCMFEFLDFCFGLSTTETAKEGRDKVTSQIKAVPNLWLKCGEVLLAFIASKDLIDYPLSAINYESPPISTKNFDQFAKVITSSVLECCLLLKQLENNNEQKYLLLKNLWRSLSCLLKQCPLSIQEECYTLVNQKLEFILKEYENDPLYETLLELLNEFCDINISYNFSLTFFELLMQLKCKLNFTDKENILGYHHIENLLKVLWKEPYFKKLIIDYIKTQMFYDKNSICNFWFFIFEEVIKKSFNKHMLAIFIQWFINNFNKIDQVFFKKLNNIFVSSFQNLEDQKKFVTLYIEELKTRTGEDSCIGENIILITTMLTSENDNISVFLSCINDVLKMIFDAVSQPSNSDKVVSSYAAVLLEVVKYITKNKKNGVEGEFVTNLCRCLNALSPDIKDMKLLNALDIFSKTICPTKNKESALALKEAITTFGENNFNDKLLIQKITKRLEKTNVPQVASKSPLGISRTLKIGQNATKEVNSSFEKVNALQLFGKDVDSMTPVKVKGSQLKNATSPSSRSKKIINSLKKTPEPPLIDEEACDFVVINTEVKLEKDKLSDHQKEVFKRRREDIPALYQDLSQSQSQFSNTWSNDHFKNNNSLKNGEIKEKTNGNEEVKPNGELEVDDNKNNKHEGNENENKEQEVKNNENDDALKMDKKNLESICAFEGISPDEDSNSADSNKMSLRRKHELNRLQMNIANVNAFEKISRFRPRSDKNKEIKNPILTEPTNAGEISEQVTSNKNETLENKLPSNGLVILENKILLPAPSEITQSEIVESNAINEGIEKQESPSQVDNGLPKVKSRRKTKEKPRRVIKENPRNVSSRKRSKSKDNVPQVEVENETSEKKKELNESSISTKEGEKKPRKSRVKHDSNEEKADGSLVTKRKRARTNKKETLKSSSIQLNENEEPINSDIVENTETINENKDSSTSSNLSSRLSASSDSFESKLDKTNNTTVAESVTLNNASSPAKSDKKRRKKTDSLSSTMKEETTNKQRKPKRDIKKKLIQKIKQLKLQDLKHFTTEKSKDKKLIFIRELSSSNIKAKPGSLKRKKDSESSNIAYSINTIPGLNDVELNSFGISQGNEPIKSSQATEEEPVITDDDKQVVKTRSGRRTKSVGGKDAISPPVLNGKSRRKSTSNIDSSVLKEEKTSAKTKSPPSPSKSTRVSKKRKSLEKEVVELSKSGIFSQNSDDVIESSQDLFSKDISASIRLSPRKYRAKSKPVAIESKAVAKRSISEWFDNNLSKTIDSVARGEDLITSPCVEVMETSLAETATCNSLCEPVEEHLALDLPSDKVLTDSEKQHANDDTLTQNLAESPIENGDDPVRGELKALEECMEPPKQEEIRKNEDDSKENSIEIIICNSPQKTIVGSPEHKGTPNLVKEFMDSTLDISPISNKNNDDDIPLIDPETEYQLDELLLEESKSEKVAEPKLFQSNLRSSRLLNMVNANSPLHKSTPTKPKRKAGRSLSGTQRTKKLMLQIQANEEKNPLNDLEILTKMEEDIQILTFSREVPSPLALPSTSILKRKINDSDECITPNAKRKRVSFNDPCISSKKIYLFDKKEYSKENFHQEISPDQIDDEEEASDEQDIDPFVERDAALSEEALELANPLLFSSDRPIFPRLGDCNDWIDETLCKKLSSAMYSTLLRTKLSEKEVYTVGDLARLTESEIVRMPFKRPSVKTVTRVLREYLNKSNPITKDCSSSDDSESESLADKLVEDEITTKETEDNKIVDVVVEERDPVPDTLEINEKMVPNIDVISNQKDSKEMCKEFLETLQKEKKNLEDCGSILLDMVEETEMIRVLKNVYNTNFQSYCTEKHIDDSPETTEEIQMDDLMKSINTKSRNEKYEIVRKILDSLQKSEND